MAGGKEHTHRAQTLPCCWAHSRCYLRPMSNQGHLGLQLHGRCRKVLFSPLPSSSYWPCCTAVVHVYTLCQPLLLHTLDLTLVCFFSSLYFSMRWFSCGRWCRIWLRLWLIPVICVGSAPLKEIAFIVAGALWWRCKGVLVENPLAQAWDIHFLLLQWPGTQLAVRTSQLIVYPQPAAHNDSTSQPPWPAMPHALHPLKPDWFYSNWDCKTELKKQQQTNKQKTLTGFREESQKKIAPSLFLCPPMN